MYFEDFVVGQRFTTSSRRITEEDVYICAGLSWDTHPLHIDKEFCRRIGFEDLVAHGFLTISVAVGLMHKAGLFEHLYIWQRLDGVRFIKPVLPGDELFVECEVLRKEETRRPDIGRVVFDVRCVEKSKGVVMASEMTFLYFRKR